MMLFRDGLGLAKTGGIILGEPLTGKPGEEDNEQVCIAINEIS